MVNWLKDKTRGDDRPAIPYADPLSAGRHPFQTFLLALCTVSGLPLVFGEPNAASMASLLPGWMAVGWGASLSLGSLIALAGSYWPRSNYATALTLERIGLLIVGPAALVYGCVILIAAGWAQGTVAACITFAFGASCLMRAIHIGRVITRAVALTTNAPDPIPLREGEQ